MHGTTRFIGQEAPRRWLGGDLFRKGGIESGDRAGRGSDQRCLDSCGPLDIASEKEIVNTVKLVGLVLVSATLPCEGR